MCGQSRKSAEQPGRYKKCRSESCCREGCVEYDKNIISIEDIIDAIKKLGYDAVSEQADTISSAVLKVSGMSCAACAARVEKQLGSLEGVHSAAVNLASERASVEYDSEKIKTSDLIKAVEAIGYKAERAEELSVDREKEQREKEIRRLRLELVISAILQLRCFFPCC